MSCGCKSKTKNTYTLCGDKIISTPVIKHIYDDCTGAPLYPITSTDAVINEEHKNLTTILEELEECKDNMLAEVEQIVNKTKEDFKHIFECRLQDRYNQLKALIDATNTRITDLHSGGHSGSGGTDHTLIERLTAVELDLVRVKERLQTLESKNYDILISGLLNLISSLHASLGTIQNEINALKNKRWMLPVDINAGNGLSITRTNITATLSLAPNMLHVVDSLPDEPLKGVLYLVKTGEVAFYRGDLSNSGSNRWNVMDLTMLVNYILGKTPVNLQESTATAIREAAAALYTSISESSLYSEEVKELALRISDIVAEIANNPESWDVFDDTTTEEDSGDSPWDGEIQHTEEENNNVVPPEINEVIDPTDADENAAEDEEELSTCDPGSIVSQNELYAIKCDVNNDNEVNVNDVTALINIILGVTPKPTLESVCSGENLIYVDPNGNLIQMTPQPGLIYIDIDHHTLLAFYHNRWHKLYGNLIDQAVGA